MYGNSSKISEKQILEILRSLDVFKEDSNYDLKKQFLINLFHLDKCKKLLLQEPY